MTESYSTPTTFQTIEEIRIRKTILLKDIQKDNDKIDFLWHSLFHKPKPLEKNTTPSKRINSLLSTGAGLIDAAILTWKLYKKFKK